MSDVFTSRNERNVQKFYNRKKERLLIRNVTRHPLIFLSLPCCSTNNVRNPDCTTRRGIIIGIGWRPDYCPLRDSRGFIALDRKLSRDFQFLLYIAYFYFRLKDTAETMPLLRTSQLRYPPSRVSIDRGTRVARVDGMKYVYRTRAKLLKLYCLDLWRSTREGNKVVNGHPLDIDYLLIHALNVRFATYLRIKSRFFPWNLASRSNLCSNVRTYDPEKL